MPLSQAVRTCTVTAICAMQRAQQLLGVYLDHPMCTNK